MDTEAQTSRAPAATSQPQMGAQQLGPQQFGPHRTDGWQSTPQRTVQIREIRPRGDETKLSIKTSEFWIWAATVAGVLIASYLVGVTAHHRDYFRADHAWFLVALLSMAYLVSRGIAKAGSATRSKDTGDGAR